MIEERLRYPQIKNLEIIDYLKTMSEKIREIDMQMQEISTLINDETPVHNTRKKVQEP